MATHAEVQAAIAQVEASRASGDGSRNSTPAPRALAEDAVHAKSPQERSAPQADPNAARDADGPGPDAAGVGAADAGGAADSAVDKGEAGGDSEVDSGEAAADDKAEKPVPPKTWAAVFRREKAARAREEASKSAVREAQALREQAQAMQAEAQGLLESFKKDPYEFVEKKGFDFDAWAKRRLAGGKADPSDRMAALEAEIERLREAPKKMQAEQAKAMQQAQLEQQVQGWLDKVPTVLSQPKYAVLKDWDGESEVQALAAMELQRTGKWLTQEQAADRILEQAQLRMQRLAKAGHIRLADTQATPEHRDANQPQDLDGPESKASRKDVRRPQRELTRAEEIARLSKQMRWHPE